MSMKYIEQNENIDILEIVTEQLLVNVFKYFRRKLLSNSIIVNFSMFIQNIINILKNILREYTHETQYHTILI